MYEFDIIPGVSGRRSCFSYELAVRDVIVLSTCDSVSGFSASGLTGPDAIISGPCRRM